MFHAKCSDPTSGTTFAVLNGFDPSKYKTCAGAAKGFHKSLNAYAKKAGYNTDYGPILRSPSEEVEYTGSKCWSVTWEEGPYEWGICTSFDVTGDWGYAEPYYSFDLHFASK